MEKIRKRNWTMLLYPEDPTHAAAIKKLESGGYKYVAILHDKDIWAEGESENHTAGEPKKEHWHVVLKFPQARWNTAIAEELGIAVNYMEPCANFDSACLYLVHANAEDKFQYDAGSLFGNLVSAVNKLLVDDDEGMRVLEIVHAIDSCPGRVSYRDMLVKACNNGLYGEFRRLGSGVKWLIDEHNQEYDTMYLEALRDRLERENFDEFRKRSGSIDFVTRCQILDSNNLPPQKME